MQSALTPGMRPFNKMHTPRPSDDFWEDDKFEDLAYSAGVNVLDADAMAEARNLVVRKQSHFPITVICEGDEARLVCPCGEDTGIHLVQTALDNMDTHRTLVANAEQLSQHCADSDMTVGAA